MSVGRSESRDAEAVMPIGAIGCASRVLHINVIGDPEMTSGFQTLKEIAYTEL